MSGSVRVHSRASAIPPASEHATRHRGPSYSDGRRDRQWLAAAAGTESERDFRGRPARFTPAICVASTDGQGALSTFSNWGSYDQDDSPHPCFVLAPGGNTLRPGAGADEYVATYQGADWRGTSFAAAYVTGLLAHHLAKTGGRPRKALISALSAAASPARVQAYASSDHGAGLAQHF
jgi:subtilisin family serine protease